MANESVKFTIELGGNAYSGVVQLDNAVRQVVKTASQAKTSFQSLGNAYAALEMLVGTVDRISGVFDSLVGSSLAFEQTQANMRTLMNGNAEAADAMLGKIREYGKNTVYDTSGLVEAQKTMMSFGIESEKAFSTLKQIGDIAMGDSNKMQSLALAFSQTTSTGKLMGQDLLQMINAGFNPLQVISEKTGKSIGTLKDEMSKGAISADMVAQAFQWATEEGALFYQGAEMAGQTVGGRIATMRDTIDEWKISLFEATGGLTAYVSEIGKMASPLASIVGIIPLIGNGFSSVKTKAIEAWSAIGKGTMWCKKQLIAMSLSAQLSGGAFQLMGIMAKSACRTISVAIMNIPIVGWIAAAVTLVVMLFKQLWDKCYGFRVVVFTVWEGLKSVFSWVQEGMQSLWVGFQENIVGPIWGFITNIASWIYEHVVQPIWNCIVVVATWLNEHIIKPIRQAIDQIGSWFREVFGGVFEWVEEQFGKLYNKIAGLVPGMQKIAQEGRKRADASWLSDHGTTTTTTDNLINAVNAPLQGLQLGGTGGGGSSLGKSNEAIATGGTRNTEIHIEIGDMIKQVVFNGGVRENQQEIERVFAESLSRVLGMAQMSVG